MCRLMGFDFGVELELRYDVYWTIGRQVDLLGIFVVGEEYVEFFD